MLRDSFFMVLKYNIHHCSFSILNSSMSEHKGKILNTLVYFKPIKFLKRSVLAACEGKGMLKSFCLCTENILNSKHKMS